MWYTVDGGAFAPSAVPDYRLMSCATRSTSAAIRFSSAVIRTAFDGFLYPSHDLTLLSFDNPIMLHVCSNIKTFTAAAFCPICAFLTALLPHGVPYLYPAQETRQKGRSGRNTDICGQHMPTRRRCAAPKCNVFKIKIAVYSTAASASSASSSAHPRIRSSAALIAAGSAC